MMQMLHLLHNRIQMEPPITQTILTNLVVTTINIAFIFPLKIVDKEVATVGEVLTYDVLIFNFGTVTATGCSIYRF